MLFSIFSNVRAIQWTSPSLGYSNFMPYGDCHNFLSVDTCIDTCLNWYMYFYFTYILCQASYFPHAHNLQCGLWTWTGNYVFYDYCWISYNQSNELPNFIDQSSKLIFVHGQCTASADHHEFKILELIWRSLMLATHVLFTLLNDTIFIILVLGLNACCGSGLNYLWLIYT